MRQLSERKPYCFTIGKGSLSEMPAAGLCSVRGLNVCGCADDANLDVVSCKVEIRLPYVNTKFLNTVLIGSETSKK